MIHLRCHLPAADEYYILISIRYNVLCRWLFVCWLAGWLVGWLACKRQTKEGCRRRAETCTRAEYLKAIKDVKSIIYFGCSFTALLYHSAAAHNCSRRPRAARFALAWRGGGASKACKRANDVTKLFYIQLQTNITPALPQVFFPSA